MIVEHGVKIAKEMKLAPAQVKTVAGLFAEGATIPFVALPQRSHRFLTRSP